MAKQPTKIKTDKLVHHPKIQNIIEFCKTYEPAQVINQSHFGLLDSNMLIEKLTLKQKDYFQFYEWIGTQISLEELISFCIIHSGQQFNFWYGTSKYKPFNSHNIITYIIDRNLIDLKKEIKNSCIGFIPERLRYLEETSNSVWQNDTFHSCKTLSEFIDALLNLETFNSDPLFKRGLLAIMEIRRILDSHPDKDSKLYKELNKVFDKKLISTLPIPADYRIPEFLAKNKMLNEFFLNNEIIPHSEYEIAIRAASINAVFELSNISGLSTYELDSLIFMNKDSSDNKYHRCMTTAY